ncbi:MAG TPA: CBS domain-containing protein, partial [Burkholderiales bacterium]|nr:CBS domain-containing protein [Burkholderiales bacterium]
VGGVMRSPLTGVVFAMELTHQWDAVMPLVVSSTVAYLLSVLVLKRSVLTEKVVRKGTHLTREYSVDPLEVFLVGEIMPRSFLCFRCGAGLESAVTEAASAWPDGAKRKLAHSQRLYPVLDDAGRLAGLVTRHQLLGATLRFGSHPGARVDELMVRDAVVGYPDMTLRELANLMAAREVSSVPIVERRDPRQVLSVMAMDQVLEARLRDVNEEHKSERVLTLRHMRALSGGRLLVRSRPRGTQRSDAEPE